jgi:hypothetical protein
MTVENILFEEADPTLTSTTNVNPLEALVGEGKKFKTAEDLARGKLEADNFVKQLQTELATLREDLNGRIKLEEFMDRLEKTPTATANGNSQNTTSNEPGAGATSQPPLNVITKEDVAPAIREREATEKANVRHVAEALRSAFDNYCCSEC